MKRMFHLHQEIFLKGRPKKDGLGIPVIPSGPLVTSYQLIKIILIISPNPKVTIAR